MNAIKKHIKYLEEIKLTELIALGIIKVLDNIISTTKSITTYQNKKILTSVLVIVSQFMFYSVIKSVVGDNSWESIIVVCICSGLGTYIAMYFDDLFKKDATYTNILTCDSTQNIDGLCVYLLKNGIKYIPFDSYNRKSEKAKTVLVFAQTRHESKLIDDFLKQSEVSYLRQILH